MPVIKNKPIICAQNRNYQEAQVLLWELDNHELVLPHNIYNQNSYDETVKLIESLLNITIEWAPYFRKISFHECPDEINLIYFVAIPERVFVKDGNWYNINNLRELNIQPCDYSIIMKGLRYI